jgi:hypothetical protein
MRVRIEIDDELLREAQRPRGKSEPVDADEFWLRARALREETRGRSLSDSAALVRAARDRRSPTPAAPEAGGQEDRDEPA